MAHVKSGSRGTGPRSLVARERFDLWLDRQLHALYDDIAREPLAADLLRLIERSKPDQSDRPEGADEESRNAFAEQVVDVTADELDRLDPEPPRRRRGPQKG